MARSRNAFASPRLPPGYFCCPGCEGRGYVEARPLGAPSLRLLRLRLSEYYRFPEGRPIPCWVFACMVTPPGRKRYTERQVARWFSGVNPVPSAVSVRARMLWHKLKARKLRPLTPAWELSRVWAWQQHYQGRLRHVPPEHREIPASPGLPAPIYTRHPRAP